MAKWYKPWTWYWIRSDYIPYSHKLVIHEVKQTFNFGRPRKK